MSTEDKRDWLDYSDELLATTGFGFPAPEVITLELPVTAFSALARLMAETQVDELGEEDYCRWANKLKFLVTEKYLDLLTAGKAELAAKSK